MRTESRSNGRSGSFIEAARRAQVIEAAIATVNAVGYHRASLAQIAERAGVSKSVISYHFDGKEELLLQVVEHVFTLMGEAIWTAVSVERDPRLRLAAYVHGYLAFLAGHREEMIAAVEIAVSHRDAEGVPRYLKEGADDTALLEEVLAAGTASGAFREVDRLVAVTTVVHALDGALTRLQIDADTDLVAYERELTPMLLAALEVRADV